MKTIDKFRATNKFLINGVHSYALMAIQKWADENNFGIIAIGFEPGDDDRGFEYTVRVSERMEERLVDHVVKLWGTSSIRVLESEVISDWSKREVAA